MKRSISNHFVHVSGWNRILRPDAHYTFRAVVVLLVFFAEIVPTCWAQTANISTYESLVIGSHRISAYAVEKNYQRFLNSNLSPSLKSIESNLLDSWFAHFLAQQVIIAEAKREGYGERIEVSNEVERMERHMLTQPNGPFYESLALEIPNEVIDPKIIYERQGEIYDALIVRLPRNSPLAATLEHSLTQNYSPGLNGFLRIATESGQADIFDGPLVWPFEPFEAIGSFIVNAKPNAWQQVTFGDLIYVYQLRGIRPSTGTTFEVLRQTLTQLSTRMEERKRQRLRHELLLSKLNFTFNWETAQHVVNRIKEIRPAASMPLNHASFSTLSIMSLGKFSRNGREQIVTVSDYIDYHNDLFLRNAPERTWDLYLNAQALLFARQDCEDARAIGIDKTPKFTEDRENYRNYLALELYERERIRPKLNVSDEQVATYYSKSRREFTYPTEVEGTIAAFDRFESARDFVQGRTNEVNMEIRGEGTSESIIITPETKVPNLPFLTKLVLTQSSPQILGPFPRGNGFCVWIPERVLDASTIPLAQVSQSIRARLEKPLLERFETELAQTLSHSFKIEDRIDYKKYGVTGSVRKPWARETRLQ